MRKIASEIDYLLRRLAVALAVVVTGAALSLIGSATAVAGDRNDKDNKEEKIEKFEKELKELKDEDSRARFDRDRVFFDRFDNNRVFFNRNIRNLPFFVRPFDFDDRFEEEFD